MWYVIQLIKPAKNRVIPQNWIQGINDQLEKFLNNRINTSQEFMVFYSEGPEANDLNGKPNENFVPDFNQPIADFPSNGLYKARILKAKSSYDDAVSYAQKRREILPAIYNQNRMNEKPLPEVLHTSSEEEASDNELDDTQNGAVSVNEQGNKVDVDMSEVFNTSLNMTERETAIQIKQELVPVFQPLSLNDNALDGLLTAPSQAELIVEIIDDMEITLIKGQIHKPLNVTDTNLIKRENDIVSGNLPYTEKKTGRIYNINGKKYEIPSKVIDSIKNWNTCTIKKDDREYDMRIVHAILLMFVEPHDLTSHNISYEVMEFIHDMIKVRAKNDEERLGAIEKYVKEMCDTKK